MPWYFWWSSARQMSGALPTRPGWHPDHPHWFTLTVFEDRLLLMGLGDHQATWTGLTTDQSILQLNEWFVFTGRVLFLESSDCSLVIQNFRGSCIVVIAGARDRCGLNTRLRVGVTDFIDVWSMMIHLCLYIVPTIFERHTVRKTRWTKRIQEISVRSSVDLLFFCVVTADCDFLYNSFLSAYPYSWGSSQHRQRQQTCPFRERPNRHCCL